MVQQLAASVGGGVQVHVTAESLVMGAVLPAA
jgi:histidine phosphotransferase ChpT